MNLFTEAAEAAGPHRERLDVLAGGRRGTGARRGPLRRRVSAVPHAVYDRIEQPVLAQGRSGSSTATRACSCCCSSNFFLLELVDDPRWGAIVSTLLAAVALVVAISDPDAGETVNRGRRS